MNDFRYNEHMNSHKYFGLKSEEIEVLQKKCGPNVLKEKKGPSLFIIYLNQFKNPLIYVLLLAGALSFYFKEFENFWLILAVIAVNSAVGFYQEFTAQKTLSALKKLLHPKAAVIRDGKRVEIDVHHLVPGDIVVLAAGDQVPADGKTLEATNLLVDEAILTGEQDAIDKKPSENALLYMGTTVLAGIGIMKVVSVGQETEIGKVSKDLAEIKEGPTPLEKRLETFSKDLVLVVLAAGLVIFIFGLLKNRDIWTMLQFSIILAVAAIPEGLPIVATVILSLGMRRILRKNGLTKKLLSVETLGSTSVICTDKTGTLTEGKMQVVKADLSNDLHTFLALILANQQKDTLEVSLWKYVEKHSKLQPKKILDGVEKVYEEPFDSSRKYSLSIIKQDGKELGYVLGAPEIVLKFCKISDADKKKVQSDLEQWSSVGLKVVGAAYKETGDIKAKSDWKWLGILGIEDPIRAEVVETIKKCQESGIKIKIVTGDYRQTAIKVASTIGIPSGAENVMESEELEKISEQELENRIDSISIFSRVTPSQKLKIVTALQNRGEVVAMTGDGVNDALALKKANIAVVVNGASDVAKEVSDLILLDNNFKTIYYACEEGRVIIFNIKKSISFLLSHSFAGIVIIFLAVLLNLPAPLTILMILWINLICDGPIDITLGFEEKEDGIMKLSPQDLKHEKILDRFVIQTSVVVSLFIGVATIILFYLFYNQTNDLPLARTIVLSAVTTANLISVFSFKNLHKSIFQSKNLFKNKFLIGAVIYGFVLTIAVVYLPFLNKIFETKPLNAIHWLYILATGILAMLIVELSKKTYLKQKKV